MWGFDAWKLKEDGAKCWNPWIGAGTAQTFFPSVLSGDGCEIDWYEGAGPGAGGELNGPADRPRFPAPGDAPALLGFDNTIWQYCSEQGGTWGEPGNFLPSIAHRCIQSNQNILRMVSVVWNMCVNLRWVVCAVTGRLPGQRGKQLHFATAPKALDAAVYRDPSLSDEWWMEPHDQTFSVGDVFFAEVAIIHRVCANRERLLQLERGEIFECEFDQRGFDSLVASLTGE